MRIACVCKTCTPPALKHDMSIQTRHDVRFPAPLFRLVARILFFSPYSLRGAEVVSPRGGLSLWTSTMPSARTLGRFPVAKGACSAGLDRESISTPTRSRVHIVPISGASARTRDYLARSAGPIAALTYHKGGPRYQLESQLICAW